MRYRLTLAAAITAAAITATAGPGAGAAQPAAVTTAHMLPMSVLASTSPVPAASPTAYCRRVLHYSCYDVRQIAHAYGLDALQAEGKDGRGRTVLIVDAYGSPTIRRDLDVFDKAYGLPPVNLKISYPEGRPPAYDRSAGRATWALETSLDVEVVHAYAPKATILLGLAPNDNDLPVMTTIRDLVRTGQADVLSQSFTETEEDQSPSFFRGLDSIYRDAARRGTSALAASGDSGSTGYDVDFTTFYPYRVVPYPASSPWNTAVGGTQLHLDDRGNRNQPDNVWNDQKLFHSPAAAGGGTSRYYSRPAFQDGVAAVVGGRRGIPDISFTAAVDGGVLIYMSFLGRQPGYYIIGGTSEACPTFAAMVAIADQVAGRRVGLVAPRLYTARPGITDITRGDNTVRFGHTTVKGYGAVRGYDLASGLGTGAAPELVNALAR